jgi:hypothetical protein
VGEDWPKIAHIPNLELQNPSPIDSGIYLELPFVLILHENLSTHLLHYHFLRFSLSYFLVVKFQMQKQKKQRIWTEETEEKKRLNHNRTENNVDAESVSPNEVDKVGTPSTW